MSEVNTIVGEAPHHQSLDHITMARSREDQTRLFNRCCGVAAFAVLLSSTIQSMRGEMQARDFPQYYMASWIVRTHAWDALYPIPNPASPRNPGYKEDSFMKPRYATLAAEKGVGDKVRYMQPPPLALFLAPLAWMSYRTAWIVWTFMGMLFLLGIIVQSARIFTICHGKPTPIAGIIMVLMAISPETIQWANIRNTSTLIGWLIGVAAINLLNDRSLRGAGAIWFAGVIKYAGAPLVPLYIAARKWSALATVAGLSILLLIVSIWIMGWPVFSEFIHKIMPTLDRPTGNSWNESFEGVILHWMLRYNRPPPHWLELTAHTARIVMLLLLIGLIFRRPAADWKYAPNVFAASAALIAWMLIFSPIYWQHYAAYIAPFWGWIAWEGTQGRNRRMTAILALLMLYFPIRYFGAIHAPPYLLTHCFWGTALILATAIWRLGSGRCIRT